jgi:uncharacterized protein (DUF736 family)
MSNVVGSLELRVFEQNKVVFGGFGQLSMLAHQFKFAVTDFVSNNPDAPCFTVHAKTPDGRLVEIGKAWRKMIRNGDHKGKDFFSFTFDDPSLEKPINVSAFPTSEKGIYEIVWQRPKKQAAPLERASAADYATDDEIPF